MTGGPTGALPAEVDVVVVGAGAAGMSAALRAASHGLETVLLQLKPFIREEHLRKIAAHIQHCLNRHMEKYV